MTWPWVTAHRNVCYGNGHSLRNVLSYYGEQALADFTYVDEWDPQLASEVNTIASLIDNTLPILHYSLLSRRSNLHY